MPDVGLERGKVFPEANARSLLNPLRRLVQSPARTVAAMGDLTRARVLEVGSGPGFFSPSLARASASLVVSDLQPGMLRMARDRVGNLTAAFVALDATALPFAPATFDAVLLATMLGEVPDPAACLECVHRVLRPGGVVGICETRRDSDFITYGKLCAIVRAHGFVEDGRRGFAWQYTARFRRV